MKRVLFSNRADSWEFMKPQLYEQDSCIQEWLHIQISCRWRVCHKLCWRTRGVLLQRRCIRFHNNNTLAEALLGYCYHLKVLHLHLLDSSMPSNHIQRIWRTFLCSIKLTLPIARLSSCVFQRSGSWWCVGKNTNPHWLLHLLLAIKPAFIRGHIPLVSWGTY